mmetsp:Transcript_9086/g.21503  ORF Transcript_9086/g.21503 Transcript_9086/m.21503 type:complete len:223 (-) Transcript_9086:1425-2093(-)
MRKFDDAMCCTIVEIWPWSWIFCCRRLLLNVSALSRRSSWHCTSVLVADDSMLKMTPSAFDSMIDCESSLSMASLASTSSVEPCTSVAVDGLRSMRTNFEMPSRATISLRVFSTSASAPTRLITLSLSIASSSRHLRNSSTLMSTLATSRMLRGLRRTSTCSDCSTWLTIAGCVSNSGIIDTSIWMPASRIARSLRGFLPACVSTSFTVFTTMSGVGSMPLR